MKTLQAGRRSSLTEPEQQALADAALRKARAIPIARASPVTPRLTPPARAETRERIARIKQLQLEASNRQIAKTLGVSDQTASQAEQRDRLTDDDKAILVELLRETVERDRFPMSPRIRSFKAILAKLDPPAPRPEPLPPPKPPGDPSLALRKKRPGTQGQGQ